TNIPCARSPLDQDDTFPTAASSGEDFASPTRRMRALKSGLKSAMVSRNVGVQMVDQSNMAGWR
ncbi:hypothetical protein JXA88_01890, partial [Candidatus Fermentibacteria bacterium]|nr:hypothetical protein [Candidatus Fermentibacteria bacterium]